MQPCCGGMTREAQQTGQYWAGPQVQARGSADTPGKQIGHGQLGQ